VTPSKIILKGKAFAKPTTPMTESWPKALIIAVENKNSLGEGVCPPAQISRISFFCSRFDEIQDFCRRNERVSSKK